MRTKVLFDLERIDEDYPPVSVESVWADEIRSGIFVIDNIPFFATQAALGDTVSTVLKGGLAYYASTLASSGNSLVRVVLFDKTNPQPLRDSLAALGCASELSHINSLIAISVARDSNWEKVHKLLVDGFNQGSWDYEEALLRH